MTKTVVTFFSGGISSYYAAVKAKEKYPWRKHLLLFTDTLIEHADLYRFLVQAATDVLLDDHRAADRLNHLWQSIPPLSQIGYRKNHLMTLRRRAMQEIPGLIWIADGRTPFEVFRDVKMLGNTRHDPCSKFLKREMARFWLEETQVKANTTLICGIGYDERQRFVGDPRRGTPGMRARWAEDGWSMEAPLADDPDASKDQMVRYANSRGIQESESYKLGLVHDNCSGCCVKMGQAGFLEALRVRPETFAYFEAGEHSFRQEIGKDVAILRDRRGGITRPLTLLELKRRVRNGEKVDPTDQGEACSCFAGGED